MFRLQPWVQPQTFMRNRFSKTNNEEPQDILQVWFAGVHADIGGGYPEKQSGLSKYPLLWMVEEAVKCGLKVDRQTVNQLGWGRQRKNSPFSYVAPNFMADPHDSMSAAWRTIEYIPKADKYKEWPKRESVLGHYIPDAEPRPIPDGAFIHESVVEKRTKDPKYRPVNMPAQYQTIPILTAPSSRRTMPRIRLRRSARPGRTRRLICPAGCWLDYLSSPSRKNIPVPASPKSNLYRQPSRLLERGVPRSSRTYDDVPAD
jgi:Uncharacterized alpha/beta hydrolase domain (DUF2235)